MATTVDADQSQAQTQRCGAGPLAETEGVGVDHDESPVVESDLSGICAHACRAK